MLPERIWLNRNNPVESVRDSTWSESPFDEYDVEYRRVNNLDDDARFFKSFQDYHENSQQEQYEIYKWQTDILVHLVAETRNLEEENADLHALCVRQSILLTGVANALRGKPPMLIAWDHSDLPFLAGDRMATAKKQRDEIDKLRKENFDYRERFNYDK